MKDETYTFFEDVREKSKTARSAHARPQRGRSRFKQYTAKEVREMSGPDYSVKLGKRMTFQELKALPESLQQEYIKDILARYKVGATAIAEVLDAHPQACLKHLKALGFTFPRGGRRSEAELERLRADFGICVAQAPTKKTTLQNLAFSFCGDFNAASFVSQLSAFIPAGQALRVSVAVEVVQPEPSAT